MEKVKDLIHQSPENFGIHRSRWTLSLIFDELPELAVKTIGGLWHILKRLCISYKQGRRHIHSPDPEYQAKKERVDKAVGLARRYPEKVVTLFSDEMGYYRYPDPARCWYERGKGQPLAEQVAEGNYKSRFLAGLDVVTGRVLTRRAPKIGVIELTRFMRQIRRAYPKARRILLIWDNWPVHEHEAVLEAAHQWGINILFLPTFAPWLNPVEKLWKKLRQEVLYMHRLAQDWKAMRKHIKSFFNRFKDGVHNDLLRYVGLLPK